MKMHLKPTMLTSSLILFLLLILSFTISISAQEVEDEREFSYIHGSETGPSHWGHIKKEWAICNTGKFQSPIDLFHRRVTVIPKSEEFTKLYRPGKALLKNRGHDIEIKWSDGNSKIKINGTYYFLTQSHWHLSSEHTINGTRFDMELHMVHQSKDLKIAVIGLLYKIGKPNQFLSMVIEKLKSVPQTGEEVDAGMINPNAIKMLGNRYYRYIGSLTTPPCTEGVLWTVNKLIGTVSIDQMKALKEAVHDHGRRNARPLQELHGRKVKLYTHKVDHPC